MDWWSIASSATLRAGMQRRSHAIGFLEKWTEVVRFLALIVVPSCAHPWLGVHDGAKRCGACSALSGRGREAWRLPSPAGPGLWWKVAMAAICGVLGVVPVIAGGGGGLAFSEASQEVGVAFEHALPADELITEPLIMNGGAAAGDLDDDGWPDLLAVRGPEAGNGVYRNRRDGTFEEVGDASGLRLPGNFTHGIALADVDEDGDLDVFFGGAGPGRPRLFMNQGGWIFEDATPGSGLISSKDTFSGAFADVDADGDLDLFVTHWSGPTGPTLPANHLWRNNTVGGPAVDGALFSPIDFIAGVAPLFLERDWSFTPNFVDLEGDGDPDLLLAVDFGGSQVLLNQGDGTFEIVTDEVISDENGMGAAAGDFDGDGLWDWFVTSIWDPNGVNEGNWGVTGNRLYRGLGDGSFTDATEASGLRQGFWGWGACAADFDLDGDLDLFHVNGFATLQASEFHDDPARLFLNEGDGSFVERSVELGVADTGQGRGVVCFDPDRDGDVDLFVSNNRGPSKFYRNELIAPGRSGDLGTRWLALDLRRQQPVRRAVGAEVRLIAGGRTQLRQVQAGNNFLSQNPHRLHIGLAGAQHVDEIEIRWPDGEVQRLADVSANQTLTVLQGDLPGVDIPSLNRAGAALLAGLLLAAAAALLRRR